MSEAASEIYGTREALIESITLTTSIENTPTGTLVYTQSGTWGDIARDIPEIGSKSEYFNGVEWRDGAGNNCRADLILKNIVRTTTGTGNALKITLTYGLVEEASEDENGDGKYQLNITSGTASILLHERYSGKDSDVTEDERILAKALLDGKTRKDLVAPTYADDGALEGLEADSVSGIMLGIVIDATVKSERGKELIAKIESGVKEYKTFGATWTETTYKTGLNNALTGLATIITPPGPQPAINGRNWLYTGAEASKTKSGSAWQITKTWTLSDAGTGWDKELYEKP